MKLKLVIGLIIVIIIGATIFYLFSNSNEKVSFETILAEAYTNHDSAKDYVIRESSEWVNLWNLTYKVQEAPQIPQVNFNEDMIIAVFEGWHNTGGYSIEIVKIIEKENSINVYVEERFPKPGEVVTLAETAPSHIVKIKKTNKQVIFKRT